MSARVRAKWRASRRNRERGTVVFIVAMTVMVLAAVGLFALRAASVEIKTAGYERQNSQTHYLSEYGILGATQEVSGSKAQLYLGLMVNAPDAKCTSLAKSFSVGGISPTPMSLACRRMGASELGNTWQNAGAQTPALVPWTSAAQPGSLGSAPIKGDFMVELSDPSQVRPSAGFDTRLGLCFAQMTVTSVGITQPILLAGSDTTSTGLFASEGLEMARARIIGGPVRCAQ